MVTRDSLPEVKRLGYKADHSPPSGAEVNIWSCTSTSPNTFMAWFLVKPRDNFPVPVNASK
jgi:hypothetical protein